MKKSIVYGLLTAGIMWFFCFGIPLDFFESATTFVVIVAGILTTIFATLFVVSLYGPAKEPEEPGMTAESNNSYIGIIGAIFFGLIIFPITLLYLESEAVSKELQENGESTTGIIVDGNSYKTRRADFSSLKIKFETADSKTYTVDYDISASQFNNLSLNQEVPIVYSKKYPTIITIDYGNTHVSKNLAEKINPVTLEAFLNIIDFKTPGETNIYLNTINEQWNYNILGPNQVLFFNKATAENLQLIKNVRLKFVTTRAASEYIAEFEKAGWKRDNTKAEITFTLDSRYVSTIMSNNLAISGSGKIHDSTVKTAIVTIQKRNIEAVN